MSSFFTAPASQRKRKRPDTREGSGRTGRPRLNRGPNLSQTFKSTSGAEPKSRKDRDESISGSDSELDDEAVSASGSDGSDEDDLRETAAERRLKLAERYLADIRAEVANGEDVGFDAAEIDRERIAARLKEDVAQDKGRIYRHIAHELDYARAQRNLAKADTLAVTGVATCAPYVYTVTKDVVFIKWETRGPGKKPKQLIYTSGNRAQKGNFSYKHHTAPILCVAASPDGKFVVTGGADRRLIAWDAATLQPLKVFTQHRDSITALAFRGTSNQLFSASKDRTIKIWSMNELAYIETLFGHQDEVLDVAAVAGSQERCVSVGARDRTARLWKVIEESQLVFRGGGLGKSRSQADGGVKFAEGSLDRVVQLDTQLFVTGSDSGTLSLYALYKKKPLHTVPLAHGLDPPVPLDQASAEASPSESARPKPTPRWITALACVPFSDLFFSGSWDGQICAWRVSADMKSIEAVGVVGQVNAASNGIGGAMRPSVRGIINDLAIFERGTRGKQGLCVVAAVGTETRLGRWKKTKGSNCTVVFEIPRLSEPGIEGPKPDNGEV